VAAEFEDIRIVGFDDKASKPSGQGALMRLVLRLSASAPFEWSQYFNTAWQQHLYGMKRRAQVSGNTLEIVAMPAELETDHLPELKKVIEETNAAYRAHATEQRRLRQHAEAEASARKEELAALKGKLKFD
jgi:hypothetical protein